MSEQKEVVNILYHSSVNAVLATAYIIFTKKAIKVKSPDQSKVSLDDMGMIAVSVAPADMTRQFAVKKRSLPI